jgi:hypothetical protein
MILLVEDDVGMAFLTFALSSEDKADGADGMDSRMYIWDVDYRM